MSLTKVSNSMISGAPVSVLDYGASPSATATNNATAFNAAIAYCAANNKTLVIPDGTYNLPAGGTVNFAANNLRIIGIGRPTLNFSTSGSGVGFYCSSGGAGTSVSNMEIRNLKIVGGPSVTNGCHLVGLIYSRLDNILVNECSGFAYEIKNCIVTEFNSVSHQGLSDVTKPSRSFHLGNNGTGNNTINCIFTNCACQNPGGIGADLEYAGSCIFNCGTFSGCSVGVQIGSNSSSNSLDNVGCLLNTGFDFSIAGHTNTLSGCYFGSTGTGGSNIDGAGNVFVGGYLNAVYLSGYSTNTVFNGVSILSTGGISGSGTYKCVGLSNVDGSGVYVSDFPDAIGDTGAYTATASGLTSAASGTATYVRTGKIITLRMPSITGTSNTNAFSLSGAPTTIRPTYDETVLIRSINNGLTGMAIAKMSPGGVLNVYSDLYGSGFVSSGLKGVQEFTVTYIKT